MSTHCQLPSRCERYGTRGTPIGIMRVTCRLGPLLRLHVVNQTMINRI